MFNYSTSDLIESLENADIKQCLCIETKIYDKNNAIIHFSETSRNLGIITAGQAHLIRTDIEGRKNIIEYYEHGDIFGKMLTPYSDINSYYILAKERCTVAFIDDAKLINKCKNNCESHNSFLNKVLISSYMKTQTHIDVLSQRTTKAKLLTFFEYLRKTKLSDKFTLPLSFSDLADYLSVDRSAMMREIKKMREAKLIETDGNTVTLIQSEYGV